MWDYIYLFITDILLGYLPQAAGCAICLFAITNQDIRSRKFIYTSCIYSAIAMAIRLAYNLSLIDFGFHTIVIWMIFIVVAIGFCRFPVMQSTLSILISGIIIAIAEILTGLGFVLAIGNDAFNEIMNNTKTIEGKIMKSICGIPANLFFLFVVIVLYILLKNEAKGIRYRSIVKSILFSIFTFGIYAIYWFVVLTDDLNLLSKEEHDLSGGRAFLFTLISFGIYGYFWAYKMGQKIDKLNNNNNGQTGILYIILRVLGLEIINFALMQDRINKSAAKASESAEFKAIV